MKRISILVFLMAGAAAAQTYYTRTNVNPLSQPVDFSNTSTVYRWVAAPSIECDCTITDVTVQGDPYGGVITISTSSTFHVVNPGRLFIIGVRLPDGTPVGCSEPVTNYGKSYLADTIDLSTNFDLPGIGSAIDINWIYVSPEGVITPYQRGDGWQSYCDHSQFEINARLGIAPC